MFNVTSLTEWPKFHLWCTNNGMRSSSWRREISIKFLYISIIQEAMKGFLSNSGFFCFVSFKICVNAWNSMREANFVLYQIKQKLKVISPFSTYFNGNFAIFLRKFKVLKHFKLYFICDDLRTKCILYNAYWWPFIDRPKILKF